MNTIPLAQRVRPQTIHQFIGQQHLVGPRGSLNCFFNGQSLRSMIFWGPPGSGKTALAEILAKGQSRPFVKLSAIDTSVKQIREVLTQSKNQSSIENRTVLLVDEIHRFSKSQQDSLLEGVETGIITLICATTENPGFEVINPLLSRCLVYLLNPLTKSELKTILKQAIQLDEILKTRDIHLKQTDALMISSGGDARKMLSIFELVVLSSIDTKPLTITNELIQQTLQTKNFVFDKKGDSYYDRISAFIKSIRGSDPNAALYWLASMIELGQDPIFIARRLIILASEDIGLANPNALLLTNATFEAVQKIGLPEAKIILSQCVIYLAASEKSNSAYMGIKNAEKLHHQNPNLSVPLHLRNAPTRFHKALGAAKNYNYAHDYPNEFVVQDYMPEKIKHSQIYFPNNNPQEEKLRNRLEKLWATIYRY